MNARSRVPTSWLATLMFPMIAAPSAAHHGVASLGVAGLEGPGAPVETSSSATLGQGARLAMIKLDRAVFETHTAAVDDEGRSNEFWMLGLGYGVRPWLSVYAVLPYSAKSVEDNSFNTAGFADMSLMAVLAFKADRGLRLVPAGESLDDLEDWHFTVYGGFTVPTGDPDVRDASGAIDPGMSLGFGRPSMMLGATASKQWGRVTGILDGSWIGFLENEYADGARVRFGDEQRGNAALCLRLFTDPARKFRLDANLEGNFLGLGRDKLDGVGERATGGRMVYAQPGVRLYLGSSSLGLGWKVPAWTDLNEEPEQQGAEGGEKVRLIGTFSTLF